MILEPQLDLVLSRK